MNLEGTKTSAGGADGGVNGRIGPDWEQDEPASEKRLGVAQ